MKPWWTGRVPLFWSVVFTLVLVWLVLTWALPYLAMWVTGGDRPLPVPGALQLVYLVLALVGAAVYVSISDESMREFLRPLVAFLRGPASEAQLFRLARLAVLLLVPVAAGAIVHARSVPAAGTPTSLRIQHPTIPGAYERLKNPFREPTDEAVKKWMDETKAAGSLETGRRAYIRAALMEGRLIFQINCRPCHGAAADGQGPMAWGFRLKPADFTDPGMIATVVEAYAFWRVTEGGPGLPPEGSPWDSARPIWKQDLTDEQTWKAILAAYDLAGVEPRKPEKPQSSLLTASAWAQSAPPPDTAESLERGKAIYVKRCLLCHGEKGDGQGPVAPYLDPRPRDFVTGSFKLRTTQSGEPPTDEDLFRVVTRGVPGTAMPGWTTLSEQERRLVIAYIKTPRDLRAKRTEKLLDAVRLQFPVPIPTAFERPHFFLGSAGKPVALWHWQSDLDAAGKNPVVKEWAEGFQKPVRTQADSGQDVTGRGVWRDGHWKVVMVRSLAPRERERDVTFEPGRLIPFAVQAWDGFNGDKGFMMSLSSWVFVTLDAPVPLTARLSSLLAVVLTGLGEWWLVRRVRPAGPLSGPAA
ncbi:MAG: c-type cytochrome [Candidatus Rokubacteria bacterium]|nr:c-type cytochrome [Candidatus Rokubacteria bacterium]